MQEMTEQATAARLIELKEQAITLYEGAIVDAKTNIEEYVKSVKEELGRLEGQLTEMRADFDRKYQAAA